MIRFSNKSVFEQPSRTNCVQQPRFDCKTCYNERNVLFDKVNAMKTFFSFLEIDRSSTCNLGIYLQDWQLCLEFISEFFTNVALRNQ